MTTERAEPLMVAWVCVWCGASLSPIDGVWTDEITRSGDYCSEGMAVGRTGTSPHLPFAPLDVGRLIEAVQRAMTDTKRAVDYSPLVKDIAAEYARLSPAATPSPVADALAARTARGKPESLLARQVAQGDRTGERWALRDAANAALTDFIYEHGSDFDPVKWPGFAALRAALLDEAPAGERG
jgi:hypothetical protein